MKLEIELPPGFTEERLREAIRHIVNPHSKTPKEILHCEDCTYWSSVECGLGSVACITQVANQHFQEYSDGSSLFSPPFWFKRKED
jgi:hypothetical protein